MVKLRLALYGHPLSGLYWEQHCADSLCKAGFLPMKGWECVFTHKALGLFLSVYVDDFKLAGRTSNLAAGWKAIRKYIELDPETPLSHYLGCGQSPFSPTPSDVSARCDPYLKILRTKIPEPISFGGNPFGTHSCFVPLSFCVSSWHSI